MILALWRALVRSCNIAAGYADRSEHRAFVINFKRQIFGSDGFAFDSFAQLALH